VDLLFGLVHELALEWLLGGQVECVQQILLPVFVDPRGIIHDLDSLFLLEWQVFFDGFGHLDTGKHSGVTFFVHLLIVVLVLGVILLRNWKVPFSTELGVRLQHAVFAISDDRVKESRNVNRVPSLTEDDITE